MNESKINWGVRFKNKVWVTGLISQTLLIVQAIILGLESLQVIDLNIERIDEWVAFVTGIINLVLVYLSYLGIVVDPTVNGLPDSKASLNRVNPADNANEKNLF